MPTNVKELKSLVEAAKQATAGLEGTDLRRTAFERVLDHLLKNGADEVTVANRMGTTQATSTETGSQSADGSFADEQQRVDAIATYFRIAPDDVLHVFDASGERPALAVHTSSLDTRKAVATREIALLVAGVRTALGLKTTTAHIRDVADDYGRLDSPNFMSTLANMADISVLGRVGSPNRVVRMKVSGAEKARELAHRLIGD
ncbi:MAG: hypothetical protein OXS29_14080 [bacterium]|nr:hypothetical protein [bacterium]MDE0287617.1 hypothetical protein [bacterium]MDE0439004.1 hypothetical protein [bacterium]